MLAIFPLAAFFLLFLAIYQFSSGDDWRHTCIASAVLWGAYLVFTTEILSLARAITPLGLALNWTLMMVFSSGMILRSHKQGKLKLPAWKLPHAWNERILLLSIAVVVLLSLLVAIIAPPATWDALNYHMARVAHWAQDRAVHYYPSGIDVQNSMPPGGEMIVLHFYVMAAGDRLANLPEWLAMLGSLVAAAYIARLIGAGSLEQWLAGTVTAALPVGIVQASNAFTDYTLAFWVVCAAVQAAEIARGKSSWKQVALAGLAGGLALVTKPTAIAYLAPLAIWITVSILKQRGWRTFLLSATAAACLALTINLGSYIRSYDLYQNFFNNPVRITEHANQLYTPAALLSNLVRNAALHTGTPYGHVNKLIYQGIAALHQLLRVDINDPRTTSSDTFPWISFRTEETLVGNFLHAGLTLIAFAAVLWKRKAFGSIPFTLALVAASSFLFFSSLFKWQIFGSRFHLAFFVLFCPLIAMVIDRWVGKWSFAAGIVLVLAAFPWLFQIDQRPLIPGEQSMTGSILRETRLDLLYANGPHLTHPYETIINKIKEGNCRSVGLMLKGGSAEYPLWVLMDAPRDDRLQMGWIVSGPSAKYEPPEFRPCAVVCEGCSQPSLNGLQSVYNDNTFQLFLGGSTNQSP